MTGFTAIDIVALAGFVAAWVGYHLAVEVLPVGHHSLNARMNRYRREWMRQLLRRENRIVDTTIMASLQNGTAFFASTSLLALGGTATLLNSTDRVLTLFADIPFGLPATRVAFELKVIGLAVIFGYAFFKFAWAYRLFNYAAILLGSVPVDPDHPDAPAAAERTALMNVIAGRHFNRGQRAFFFALAYLGWFVSAYVLMGATAAVLYVMARRQFVSDAAAAIPTLGALAPGHATPRTGDGS